MNTISIGKGSSNDIIVDDFMASWVHCRITQDDNGNFILQNLDYNGGTYVNDIKRQSVKLNSLDVVRIGSTTIPWKTYFETVVIPGIPTKSGSPKTPEDKKKPLPPKDQSERIYKIMGFIALLLSLVGLAIGF